ncbi:MAG: aspartate kinase [Bacillota bacterium]
MGLKVCKFGGTSLCSAENIKKVAEIIKSDAERKFVVVSAPGKRFSNDIKITDKLYECANLAQNVNNCDEPFSEIAVRYTEICEKLGSTLDIEALLAEVKAGILESKSGDYAASRGEYLNGRIIADYIGFEFVDPADFIKFDENGKYVEDYTKDMIKRRLKTVEYAIIPGFYGATPDGIKTFSRGGSDITGSIVAGGVEADIYENWTDVDGFFAADPRIVRSPKSIECLTYRELRELSYMGASVLHADAIFPVQSARIPINIKNTFDPSHPGTMILPEIDEKDYSSVITGIAGKRDFEVIYIEKGSMNGEVGFARKILSVLERYGVVFEHMPSGIDTLSVVIAESELAGGKREKIIEKIREAVQPDDIHILSNMALVATVGHGMSQTKGTSARLFGALSKNDINVVMIDQGSSEMNIIVGVANEDYIDTIRAIYNEFLGEY